MKNSVILLAALSLLFTVGCSQSEHTKQKQQTKAEIVQDLLVKEQKRVDSEWKRGPAKQNLWANFSIAINYKSLDISDEGDLQVVVTIDDQDFTYLIEDYKSTEANPVGTTFLPHQPVGGRHLLTVTPFAGNSILLTLNPSGETSSLNTVVRTKKAIVTDVLVNDGSYLGKGVKESFMGETIAAFSLRNIFPSKLRGAITEELHMTSSTGRLNMFKEYEGTPELNSLHRKMDSKIKIVRPKPENEVGKFIHDNIYKSKNTVELDKLNITYNPMILSAPAKPVIEDLIVIGATHEVPNPEWDKAPITASGVAPHSLDKKLDIRLVLEEVLDEE